MEEKLEIAVNDENFKHEVLESASVVLVDFWADWCGPCKMFAPVIEEIAKDYKDKLKVCKLDVDNGPLTSKRYAIMNVPTLMIFKNGEVMDKFVGITPKNEIITKISQYI